MASTIVAGVSGIALGAGLMYALDPTRGRARRARLRDKMVHAEHRLADEARTAAHDLRNRGRGLAHDVASVARRGRVDDDILQERVRARLGRAIPHPRGIEVSVNDAVVTLRGPVLLAEVERLEHEVGRVPGVAGVVNRCVVHAEPGVKRALQGERPFGHRRVRPAGRLLMALGAGALALAGLRAGTHRR
jgi:BON domain